MAWEVADEEERSKRKEDGRTSWEKASEQEREDIREHGRCWWNNLTENEVIDQIEKRIISMRHMDLETREIIMENLNKGREKGIAMKQAKAAEKYEKEGPPDRVPNLKVWDCSVYDENRELCKFNCVKSVDCLSFVNVSDLKILKWLCSHRLMDVECNKSGCKGECYPIALGQKVGLKCLDCLEVSKGGLRGFWAKGKLGVTRMMSLVFGIVKGLSFPNYTDTVG